MRLEYDFRIGDRDAGTFVLVDDGAELRQLVSFQADDGSRYENRYAVRYHEGRATAYRVGDGEWVDCASFPPDHFPTSAYPLLVRGGTARYVAIDEDTGALRPRELERLADRVIERQDGTPIRTFHLRDGVIVRIDWGGAVSNLRTVPEA